ncbi:hypothetical protein [Staphylococcus kloosii]|jgi:predicted  nucleic acid-binding Zn-ribbon protein|uniref:hypothetical protein n=1 Tax=Staphylococcus kloosii TaxID=29384 RepID=UPI000D1E16FF|nr:hypothetical protein [Staphylococcus kloosii]PTJ78822.1 hypothetical protein BUZ59_05745 [Staphylococcus kloosii]
MVKTVQDNTINIFDNQIYDKGVKAKEVKQKYNDLTDRIKQLNAKITHYQNNDEFAEATKLKRLQSDLESDLVAVDEQLNTDDYKVTNDEFNSFYNAYREEMSAFKDEHQKLKQEMNKQLQSVAETYQKMVENKNDAGRRISRERFVKQERVEPNSISNRYKGQMLAHEVNLGDGDKYNEQTTPRGYAWQLEEALKNVVQKEFQQYHYGHKQW